MRVSPYVRIKRLSTPQSRTVLAGSDIHPSNVPAGRTFEHPSEQLYDEKLEQVDMIGQINQEIRANIPDP